MLGRQIGGCLNSGEKITENDHVSYIYIFTNKSFPGQVKVGMTTKHPSQRATELQTTGVPTPFLVYAMWDVPAAALKDYERKAHKALDWYRMEKNREFFKIDAAKAKSIIAAIIPSKEKIEAEVARAKLESDKKKAEQCQWLRGRIDEYKKERNGLVQEYNQLKANLSEPDRKIVKLKHAACITVGAMGSVIALLLVIAVVVTFFAFIKHLERGNAVGSFIVFILLLVASAAFSGIWSSLQDRLDNYRSKLPLTHRLLNQRLIPIANKVRTLDRVIESDTSELNKIINPAAKRSKATNGYSDGGGMSYSNVYSKRPIGKM